MLATVCAEKHAKFFRLKMIWKIFRCTVKRFSWNTFNAIFLHFHFAIECSLTPFFYHFFKGSFELTNKPYIKTSSVSFYLKRFPLGSCTTSMEVLFAILCTLFHYARLSFAIVRGTHTLPSNFLVLFSFSLAPATFHSILNAPKNVITFGGGGFCVWICVPLFKFNVQLLKLLLWEKFRMERVHCD